nr:MAG: hypothetical protein [uncultured archaeon]
MKIRISIIKPIYIIIGILSFCFTWMSISVFFIKANFNFLGGGSVAGLFGTESSYIGIEGIIYLIGFILGCLYLDDNYVGLISLLIMFFGVVIYLILFFSNFFLSGTESLLSGVTLGAGIILAFITSVLIGIEYYIFKSGSSYFIYQEETKAKI